MPSDSNNTQFDIFMFLFWSCDGTVYVCRRHLLIYRVQGSQTCGSWASCRSLASLHLLPSLLYLMFVNRTNWAHSIGPAVQWNCMAAIIWKVVFVLFGEFYLVVKGKNTSLQHLWFLFSAWGACLQIEIISFSLNGSDLLSRCVLSPSGTMVWVDVGMKCEIFSVCLQQTVMSLSWACSLQEQQQESTAMTSWTMWLTFEMLALRLLISGLHGTWRTHSYWGEMCWCEWTTWEGRFH